MLPSTQALLWMLRTGLFISAFGWGISFYVTFAGWPAAEMQLRQMGADPIAYQPLLDYWLKMASSAFGCIGLAALLAALLLHRFVTIVHLLAPFHLIVGGALTMAALRNRLAFPEHPTFIPDIVFCFTVALLIGLPLIQAWRAKRNTGRP
jgi:hypothetical protein